MTKKTPVDELTMLASVQFRLIFGMLHQKGLVSYSDLQEQLAQVRETMPKEHFTKFIEANLNIIEALYQDGPYKSPLPRDGDPDR